MGERETIDAFEGKECSIPMVLSFLFSFVFSLLEFPFLLRFFCRVFIGPVDFLGGSDSSDLCILGAYKVAPLVVLFYGTADSLAKKKWPTICDGMSLPPKKPFIFDGHL